MPSGELSIIRLWRWAHDVSLFESLLLGIHNYCSQTPDKIGIKLVQMANFYTLYTNFVRLLNKLSFFIQKPVTVCAQLFNSYTSITFLFLKSRYVFSTHHPQGLYIQLNKGLY